MKIKTFYAKSMQAGLRLVKEQLGPDALILSSRQLPTPGAGRNAAGIEIVAAVDGDSNNLVCPSGTAYPTTLAKVPASRRGATLKLEDTCDFSTLGCRDADCQTKPISQDRRCRTCAPEEAKISDSHRLDPPADQLAASRTYQWLLSKEINSSLASRLLEDACSALPPEDRADTTVLQQAVVAAARKLVSVPSRGGDMPAKRIVFFVGPTGVGKTTSIAKLAAHLALKQRRRIVLITLDGYRIGAVEQLRTYAGFMGVPFRFVQSPSELRQVIDENSRRDYILIDTIGHGPRDPEVLRDLGLSLAMCGDVEGHLVVSATTKPGDIPEIMARFDCCAPDHLLFTKLDETRNLGPILNELVRTGLPLRYYSDGQRVPEDFHVANRDIIVDLVLN